VTPPMEPHHVEKAADEAKNLAAWAGYLTVLGTFLYGLWRYLLKQPAAWLWSKTVGEWWFLHVNRREEAKATKRREKEDRERERQLISGINTTLGNLKDEFGEFRTHQEKRMEDLSEGQSRGQNLMHTYWLSDHEARFVTDAQGNCLAINDAFRNLTGWTLDQLRGKGWKNLIPPDQLDEAEDWWKRIIEDQLSFAARDAVYVHALTGEHIPVHVTVRGVRGKTTIFQWAGSVIPAGTIPGQRMGECTIPPNCPIHKESAR